ncbi:hypothetical protein PR048_016937 [Dryococelus australis]|uniref:Uncharacterized protein n=1 Tax=Dryococelus australis TaxID=614101 RepID=A0ABQ9H867_9NEOP|nr:hypothetical protein PR048_016937 [Dryococelus australis]
MGVVQQLSIDAGGLGEAGQTDSPMAGAISRPLPVVFFFWGGLKIALLDSYCSLPALALYSRSPTTDSLSSTGAPPSDQGRLAQAWSRPSSWITSALAPTDAAPASADSDTHQVTNLSRGVSAVLTSVVCRSAHRQRLSAVPWSLSLLRGVALDHGQASTSGGSPLHSKAMGWQVNPYLKHPPPLRSPCTDPCSPPPLLIKQPPCRIAKFFKRPRGLESLPAATAPRIISTCLILYKSLQPLWPFLAPIPYTAPSSQVAHEGRRLVLLRGLENSHFVLLTVVVLHICNKTCTFNGRLGLQHHRTDASMTAFGSRLCRGQFSVPHVRDNSCHSTRFALGTPQWFSLAMRDGHFLHVRTWFDRAVVITTIHIQDVVILTLDGHFWEWLALPSHFLVLVRRECLGIAVPEACLLGLPTFRKIWLNAVPRFHRWSVRDETSRISHSMLHSKVGEYLWHCHMRNIPPACRCNSLTMEEKDPLYRRFIKLYINSNVGGVARLHRRHNASYSSAQDMRLSRAYFSIFWEVEARRHTNCITLMSGVNRRGPGTLSPVNILLGSRDARAVACAWPAPADGPAELLKVFPPDFMRMRPTQEAPPVPWRYDHNPGTALPLTTSSSSAGRNSGGGCRTGTPRQNPQPVALLSQNWLSEQQTPRRPWCGAEIPEVLLHWAVLPSGLIEHPVPVPVPSRYLLLIPVIRILVMGKHNVPLSDLVLEYLLLAMYWSGLIRCLYVAYTLLFVQGDTMKEYTAYWEPASVAGNNLVLHRWGADTTGDYDETVHAKDEMNALQSVCAECPLASPLNTDEHTTPATEESKLDIEDEVGSEDDHEDSIGDDYDDSVDSEDFDNSLDKWCEEDAENTDDMCTEDPNKLVASLRYLRGLKEVGISRAWMRLLTIGSGVRGQRPTGTAFQNGRWRRHNMAAGRLRRPVPRNEHFPSTVLCCGVIYRNCFAVIWTVVGTVAVVTQAAPSMTTVLRGVCSRRLAWSPDRRRSWLPQTTLPLRGNDVLFGRSAGTAAPRATSLGGNSQHEALLRARGYKLQLISVSSPATVHSTSVPSREGASQRTNCRPPLHPTLRFLLPGSRMGPPAGWPVKPANHNARPREFINMTALPKKSVIRRVVSREATAAKRKNLAHTAEYLFSELLGSTVWILGQGDLPHLHSGIRPSGTRTGPVISVHMGLNTGPAPKKPQLHGALPRLTYDLSTCRGAFCLYKHPVSYGSLGSWSHDTQAIRWRMRIRRRLRRLAGGTLRGLKARNQQGRTRYAHNMSDPLYAQGTELTCRISLVDSPHQVFTGDPIRDRARAHAVRKNQNDVFRNNWIDRGPAHFQHLWSGHHQARTCHHVMMLCEGTSNRRLLAGANTTDERSCSHCICVNHSSNAAENSTGGFYFRPEGVGESLTRGCKRGLAGGGWPVRIFTAAAAKPQTPALLTVITSCVYDPCSSPPDRTSIKILPPSPPPLPTPAILRACRWHRSSVPGSRGSWWWRRTLVNVAPRGGVVARALASHQGDPGSISGRFTPGFRTWESYRKILLAGGFSRGTPAPPPLHSSAAPS